MFDWLFAKVRRRKEPEPFDSMKLRQHLRQCFNAHWKGWDEPMGRPRNKEDRQQSEEFRRRERILAYATYIKAEALEPHADTYLLTGRTEATQQLRKYFNDAHTWLSPTQAELSKPEVAKSLINLAALCIRILDAQGLALPAPHSFHGDDSE